MCGRVYEIYTDEELSARFLDGEPIPPVVSASVYNLCPTQNSPVLRVVDGKRQFNQMRLQLVPVPEPAFTTKLSTINARSETVFESRLYRDIILHQRCIVPISGFFEWKRSGNGNRPRAFKIYLHG